MILLFSMLNVVSADETNKDMIKIKKFDETITYDKIPHDVLLVRDDHVWMKQAKHDPDFLIKQKSIKSYLIDHSAGQNEWSVAMKKSAAIIQNFDVMIGKTGNGFELVGLVTTKEKMMGMYSAGEPEKRFHGWIATTYALPDNIKDINDRIDKLTDNIDQRFVVQVVDAFNDQARHGNVPSELAAIDPYFWIITASISTCNYDTECDSAFMTKVRDEKLYELEIPTGLPITNSTDLNEKYVLPMTSVTWTDARHHTNAFAKPFQCDYGNCKIPYSKTSTGTHDFSLHPNGGHGVGKYVDIYVSSCGKDTVESYNVVNANFEIGLIHHWNGFDVGYGCAIDYVYAKKVSDRPHSTWVWNFSGTTNAYKNS